MRAAIRGIEAQQRKDAKTRAKRKGEGGGGGGGGGGGKQVIEMNVGLGVVDLATEQALARAKELAGDAVVGEDASSEDTRESGGRIRLRGRCRCREQGGHPRAELASKKCCKTKTISPNKPRLRFKQPELALRHHLTLREERQVRQLQRDVHRAHHAHPRASREPPRHRLGGAVHHPALS